MGAIPNSSPQDRGGSDASVAPCGLFSARQGLRLGDTVWKRHLVVIPSDCFRLASVCFRFGVFFFNKNICSIHFKAIQRTCSFQDAPHSPDPFQSFLGMTIDHIISRPFNRLTRASVS